MSTKIRLVSALLTFAAVVSAQAEGKVYNWVGGSGGSVWAKATNWKDASGKTGIPGAEDSAIIASGAPNFSAAGFTVGNLTISVNVTFNAAALPAETSEAAIIANPTVIKVAGKFEIAGSAVVTVVNHAQTGAALKFEVGEFALGQSAKILADGMGWKWYACTDESGDEYSKVTLYDKGWYAVRALGSGYYNPYCGAGHGTYGKRASGTPEVCGIPYGNKYAPICPGSPGAGSVRSPNVNATGGGTVWIACAGKMAVNGTITADAVRNNTTTQGASGGSIWLAAKTFAFGPAAALTAQTVGSGGNVSASGGRISLAQNVTDEQLARLLAGEEPSELTYADEITLVSASVLGGSSTDPRPGTLTTVQGPQEMQIVTVQSDSVFATGVSPVYGSAPYMIGSTQTFTAPDYGFDPADGGIRYECLGYIVSNETAEVGRGVATSVDVTIGQAPQSVTWRWGVPERRTVVRKPANGALRLGGETLPGDAVQWLKSGMPAPVEVIPDSGYEFLCWEGNVPYGAARTNPMAFTEWKIYDVTPVLRTAGDAPTERTWSGTGAWTDVANWTPANLPGADDTVVIAKGVCTVSNGLSVAGVSVIPTATLNIGTAGEVNPYLTVAGDLSVTGVPASGKSADRPILKFGFGPNMAGNGAISVGGDLTLGGEAVVTVCGGPTNDVFSHASGATSLAVAKTLTVTDSAALRLESDYMTGGSVKITATDVVIGETATIDAAGRGYRWNNDVPPAAPGIPAAFNGYAGGSHGGKGQKCHDMGQPSDPYGFANAPVQPGSPAGVSPYVGNYPGGLVRIHAKTMTVEGTVTADATVGENASRVANAGGGIWLTADKYAFGANAVLTATGGACSNASFPASGGGGRISVGFLLTETQIDELAQTGKWTGYRAKRTRDEADFRAELGNDQMTIDVHTQENVSGYDAPGTFTFVDGRAPGLVIFVW